MSYSEQLFNFKSRPLNVLGVLAALGPLPTGHQYMILLSQVHYLIYRNVRNTARRLNTKLKDAFKKDMYDIEEYVRFPEYIGVMRHALSKSGHIGVSINKQGISQARFVNTDLLGDLGLLQEIQHAAYGRRGTLEQWMGLYNKWLSGQGDAYSRTVGIRLDMMRSMSVAPFWSLIEFGNQEYRAYPVNGPKRTLLAFRGHYTKEMLMCFTRSVLEARLLVAYYTGVLR